MLDIVALLKKTKRKHIYRLVFFLLALGYLINEAVEGGDFCYYLSESQRMLQKLNIYEPDNDLGYRYGYAPTLAFVFIPLSFLPSVLANFIWLVCNVFFIYRIFILFHTFLPAQDKRQVKIFIVVFLLLMQLRFVLYNFGTQQITIFLMYSMLESLYLFGKKRYFLGALLLGLGITVKYIPLVMLPYLLYRKELRGFAYAVISCVFWLMLPALFFGLDYYGFLIKEWANSFAFKPGEEVKIYAAGAHDIQAWLFTLLSETQSKIDLVRNIINIPVEKIKLVVFLVQAFFVALTLWFLRSWPFRAARNKLHRFWEVSYLLMVTPLIFPVQQKYAFIMLLPACYYLGRAYSEYFFTDRNFFPKSNLNISLFFCFVYFVLCILTTDGIIGRYWSNLANHFKLITYGSFSLLVALMVLTPGKLPVDFKEEA